MFNPSREEVREMFFATWRKYRAGEPLAGIETIALQVILLHPEYHAVLDHPERYRDRDYVDESNPFLHMSLHLALEEQLSIDQPPGIAAAWTPARARGRSARGAAPGAGMPGRDGVARPARAVRRPMQRPIWIALPRAHYAGSNPMTPTGTRPSRAPDGQ